MGYNPPVNYQVILYYKYVHIENPQEIVDRQREICQKLGLKGRILISSEGINGTLEGESDNISQYTDYLSKTNEFKDIEIKYSEGTGTSFPKLKIKVRSEIVSAHLGEEDINPNQLTGKYLEPDELKEWYEKGEEFYIVDMRNGYEQKGGHFAGSINSEFENFRDLPQILEKISHLKNKKIVPVCTGGVRCEKASGYLISKGFSDVYQLHGGMHKYIEKYPNQEFLGKLYVFDDRILIDFGGKQTSVIAKCDICSETSENYVNCTRKECNKHLIMCDKCIEMHGGESYCSEECRKIDQSKTQTI